jgi:tRNA-dihydrouridine synthase 1
MVERLHAELNIPVTVKIRALPTEEKTLELVKRIEAAGASLITVHGRLKEHNKQRIMHANYHIIRRIKETVKIPVIVNGGISCFQDIG